jgi:ribosomal protein L37E
VLGSARVEAVDQGIEKSSPPAGILCNRCVGIESFTTHKTRDIECGFACFYCSFFKWHCCLLKKKKQPYIPEDLRVIFLNLTN